MANVQGNVYGHSDAWGIPFDFYSGTTGVVQGGTINMQTALLVLNPGGAITALAINLPLNPPDGAWAEISSTLTITGVTVSANTGDSILTGGTLGAAVAITPVAATTAGSATALIKYRYTLNGFQSGNTFINPRTWIRVQ